MSSAGTLNNNAGARAAGIIVIIVVLIIFCVISCTCARQLRRAVVSELQHAVATVPHAVATIPPISYAVQLWEIDAPTMERFLRDLAKEKPVRFTAQQLCNFTTNYSTVLGSGGFGVVYKGQFPNGVKIAVKVLKRSLHDKRAEEQFMAERGFVPPLPTHCPHRCGGKNWGQTGSEKKGMRSKVSMAPWGLVRFEFWRRF